MKLNDIKQPVMYVAIGPSGSGKSTVFKRLKESNPDLQHYSWDQLRLDWYSPDYATAYKMSTEDPDFSAKTDKHFHGLMETGKDVYVDNTNLTPRRRRPLLDTAKKLGYKTIAITFDESLETILARQKTRGDKEVPSNAVIQQHNSMVLPQPGEFNQVIKAGDIT